MQLFATTALYDEHSIGGFISWFQSRVCLMCLQKTIGLFFWFFPVTMDATVRYILSPLFHDVDVRLITGHCPSYDGVVLITGKMLELQPV